MRAPSLRLLLGVLLLGGCPHPGPAPAARGRDSSPAPLTASPADAPWPTTLPPEPGRRGAGDATTLQDLAASQEIFTVEAALPALAALTPERIPALQAALEADPRWRVGRWEEDLVAWRRCRSEAGGWSASWAGYCTDDTTEWRIMLVLGGSAPDGADPLDGGTFRVRAGPTTPSGWRSGTLLARGAAVTLEIHERSPDLALEKTATTLVTLDGELSSLIERPVPPRGAWIWADAPGLEAVTGERIRGEVRPPSDLPPDVTGVEAWVQWDGEPPRSLVDEGT